MDSQESRPIDFTLPSDDEGDNSPEALQRRYEELRREIQRRVALADAGTPIPMDREAFGKLCAERFKRESEGKSP